MSSSSAASRPFHERFQGKQNLHWKFARLGDHTLKIGSGVTPRGGHASYLHTGVPLIRSQNVHMNRFEPTGLAYISAEQDADMAASRVQPGDVLLNITGASIGRVCVVPSDVTPANVNQHVMIIRSDGSWLPEFLSFYLSSPAFQELINDGQSGATRQALTKSMIESFKFPRLELPQQNRIAADLLSAFATVNKALNAGEERLIAAESLSTCFLREVFEGQGASNWKQIRLGDLTRTCSGATPPRGNAEYYGGEIPWVKTGELKDGFVDEIQECVTEAALRDCSLPVLPEGTLLIAMYGQGKTRGRTGLLARAATTNQACFAILPNRDRFDPIFLQLWFRSKYASLRQLTESRGGNQPNLNGVLLRELLVPIPPIDIQLEVASGLSARLNQAADISSKASQELAMIESLPKALLRAAFEQGQSTDG